MRKIVLCPECGSTSVVPIVYGTATKELMNMEEEGSVIMGGYSSSDQDPEFHCNECGYEWNEFDEEADLEVKLAPNPR
jgi:transposase-like protein